MKKKLITLAVAAAFAPALALADVTVYGQAHLSVDSHSGNGGTTSTGTQDGMQLASNSSRLGFKGASDLSNGMKAVYQYEFGVEAGSSGGNPLTSTRDTFIGLAGDFGTILAGRLPLANQYLYDVNFFADQVGDVGNFEHVGQGRVSRALAYASPTMSGISVLAAFVPNTQESLGIGQAAANKQSSYTLRGSYTGGPITAALSYQSIGVAGLTAAHLKDAKLTVTSLSGMYDFGAGKAGVQYTSTATDSAANNGGASLTDKVLTAGASFNLSSTDTVKLQYTKASATSPAPATSNGATMIAVGYDHSMNKTTTVYVALAKVSNDAAAKFSASGWGHGGVGTPVVGKSPQAFSVGAVYKF